MKNLSALARGPAVEQSYRRWTARVDHTNRKTSERGERRSDVRASSEANGLEQVGWCLLVLAFTRISVCEVIMPESEFTSLESYREYPVEEMRRRSKEFRDELRRRRTVREFSDRAVPREIIEACLMGAGAAPSGANLQPWHFVVVTDPAIKREIRVAAEGEEREFYERRAPREWLDARAPLGTDASKPFLEVAPYLIAVFAATHSALSDGRRVKNYYVSESVGIATGLLVASLHHAGLATLTHTPSPMGFLNTILDRPADERPYLLLVTGYPAPEARVPRIRKKSLEEIATFR